MSPAVSLLLLADRHTRGTRHRFRSTGASPGRVLSFAAPRGIDSPIRLEHRSAAAYRPWARLCFQARGMEIKRSGSQPSQEAPAEHFTGTVRIDALFQASPPGRASGTYV